MLSDELGFDVHWSAVAYVGGDVAALKKALQAELKVELKAESRRHEGSADKGLATVARPLEPELKTERPGQTKKVLKTGSLEPLRGQKVNAVVVMCGLNDWKQLLNGGRSPETFRRSARLSHAPPA